MAMGDGVPDTSERMRKVYAQMFELFWAKDGTAAAAEAALHAMGAKGEALVNISPGGLNYVDDSSRMVGAEPFPGSVFAGGIRWVPDGCGFDVEPEPDSKATEDLSRALEGSLAAGVWNGTSFGRK